MLNLTNGARGGTFCLGSPGLAEGTNAATFQFAAAFTYVIDGIQYAQAIADNQAFTAADEQADDTECLYLVCIDAAGTVTTVKGEEVLTADITGGDAVLEWPEPTEDSCPVGAIRVANDGATFTAGTTDLGAATVTDTYYNLFAIPPQPLAS